MRCVRLAVRCHPSTAAAEAADVHNSPCSSNHQRTAPSSSCWWGAGVAMPLSNRDLAAWGHFPQLRLRRYQHSEALPKPALGSWWKLPLHGRCQHIRTQLRLHVCCLCIRKYQVCIVQTLAAAAAGLAAHKHTRCGHAMLMTCQWGLAVMTSC